MSEDRELRDAPLGLRITASLKKAIEQAAKDDHRSVSSLTEKVLTEWLKERGYLK